MVHPVTTYIWCLCHGPPSGLGDAGTELRFSQSWALPPLAPCSCLLPWTFCILSQTQAQSSPAVPPGIPRMLHLALHLPRVLVQRGISASLLSGLAIQVSGPAHDLRISVPIRRKLR